MKFLIQSILFIFIIILTGCASPFMKIDQPSTPFDRPGYTIYSPQGQGWLFIEGDQPGKHALTFLQPQKSKTHTLYANVEEIPSYANFETPQEFQSYFQKGMQVGFDPRRYKIVEEENKLNNRFGDFSVSHYSSLEDHGAAQFSDFPYLLMKTSGYYFIHPHKENLIINVIYSERGKPGELDDNFKEKAKSFTNGLNLKK